MQPFSLDGPQSRQKRGQGPFLGLSESYGRSVCLVSQNARGRTRIVLRAQAPGPAPAAESKLYNAARLPPPLQLPSSRLWHPVRWGAWSEQ